MTGAPPFPTHDRVLELVRRAFLEHERVRLPGGDLTPAAVLVPIYEKEGRSHILFAQRTLTVRHHKGQISFPGGARDGTDRSLLETALRETEEEIGVRPRDVEILAELDEMVTPTGFHVHPYVGNIPYPYPFRVNDAETAALIEVPLDHLMVESHHRLGFRRFQDRIYEIHYYTYESHTIWGVTGHILHGLLQACRSAAAK